MFPGLDIGIVITNLTGRPLLMQLRGIDARSATTAARQAASVVLDHLRMQADGTFFDYQGTGDLPLNAKTGKVYVLNRRYAVVYRQVQSLFVMAVTAPDANLFSVVDLSENVGRLLVGIMGQKGKRVEPERLAKKYGEVYAALEEMVQGSLAGEAALEEAAGVKRKEEKEGGSSRKLGKFGISFVKRQKKGVEDSPLRTITVRTLADNASSFGTHPPGEPPAPTQPQRYVQPVEFAVQAPAPEPPVLEAPEPPPTADDPFAGMALEDLSIPAGVSGMRHPATDPFGNALPAQPDSLAALAATMAQPEGAVGAGLQFGAGKASPLPAGPPDMKMGGLYLVEVYRGVVEGSRLARAGIEGVVMEKMLPDNPPSQLFRLHAADAAPAAQLPLSAAGIDRFQVDRADPSNPSDVVFRATLGARSTVGGSHHFARYRLPPLAAPCPLAARVFVVRGPGGAAKPGCVVVVEMRASGKLTAALTGLVLDVEVPIAMGMPGRVTPRGEWCASMRVMRFTRNALAPGERAACRIAFPAAKAATYAQLVKGVKAAVAFSGASQGTLSGVALMVGQDASAMEPSYSVFHGQLDLVPRAAAA